MAQAPKNETVVVRLKSGEVKLGILLDGKNWFIDGIGFTLSHTVEDWAPLPFTPIKPGPWQPGPNKFDPAQADISPPDPLLEQRVKELDQTVKDAGLEEFIDEVVDLVGVSGLPDMILGYENNEAQGIAFTMKGADMLACIQELQLGGCNKVIIGIYEGSIEVPLGIVMYASPV